LRNLFLSNLKKIKMEEIQFDISRKVYSQEQFDKEYRYEKPVKTWRSFLEGHISKFNFWEQSKIWFPFLDWIPKYRANCLIPDILAGFTVAIMNVPQAMAYGSLASLPPVIGLYTSFLPSLLYAFFGTCMHTSMGMHF
jgi:hypothetical protein